MALAERLVSQMRSAWMMGLGTVIVLIVSGANTACDRDCCSRAFTDPMVDVLAAVGTKVGVPAFYVSFILAPLASNASEVGR